MIKIKCDNDDGSTNWEQRANIIIIMSLCAGVEMEDALKDIEDVKIRDLVEQKWKSIKERAKLENNT